MFKDRPVILMVVGLVLVTTGVAMVRVGSSRLRCLDCEEPAGEVVAEVVEEPTGDSVTE